MKKIHGVVLSILATGVSAAASAATGTPVDYTQLSSQVDFTGVATVVLAIGGSLAGIYVAIKGVRMGLSMLRG